MTIFEAISQYAARRICTQWNFGLNISDELHTEAMAILEPLNIVKVVKYRLIDSYCDDFEQEYYMCDKVNNWFSEIEREAYEWG